MSRPIDSALSVVEGLITQRTPGRRIPTFENLISVISDFRRIRFDISTDSDSDGFLFQCGEVNWFSEPTFTVGFVRQMEVVDAEGGHEGYSQVQLEYRYRVDDELRSLESRNSWWFPESGISFDEWIESVKQEPVWRVVRRKAPVGFDVSQELA